MSYSSFKTLLDRQHDWPCIYVFKFVVHNTDLDDVLELLPDIEPTLRYSENRRYIGVTFRAMMHSSEEVIKIYESANNIDDIFVL